VKDESTDRKKEVGAQRDDESTNEYGMNTHQRRNFSEPSSLETPR
jgi:hypothetical protein